MNFKVDSAVPSQTPMNYPMLMQSVNSSRVVLFTEETRGFRLVSDGFGPAEGGWYAANDTRHWRPFVGTITVTG